MEFPCAMDRASCDSMRFGILFSPSFCSLCVLLVFFFIAGWGGLSMTYGSSSDMQKLICTAGMITARSRTY